MKKLFFILLLSLLLVSVAWGQIVAWDFDGNDGNEVTVDATTNDTNLNISSISRGAGINPSNLGNAYSASAFTPSGTKTDAITGNDYFQFTIKADENYQVSLSTLDVTLRRSSTGPNTFAWQYSLDGFATGGIDFSDDVSYTSTSTNGEAQAQLDLSGISVLQNVASSTTITIRLYAWGASAEGGTFAIGRLSGNDLAIGGSVIYAGSTPIAEAPTFNPPAGNYISAQSVILSSATPGAAIYYTLNGDNPTDGSTLYTSAIQITESTTVKAIAYATGYIPSSVAIAEYVIETANHATIPYSQTFDTDLGDTYSYSVSGPTKTWYHTDGAAAVNGFNSGDTEEDWLILPGLNMNLNQYETMIFDTWGLHGTPGEDNYLKLYYSTNYAGIGDPGSAIWTEIPFTAPAEPDVWANSGLLDLSAISGTDVFFAFKYYAVSGNYTYWKVDNIDIYNLDPNQAVVTVSTSALSGFTYEIDNGPSASQSFTVTGVNLSGPISISAPANFKISSNELMWGGSVNLNPVGGTVAEKIIYVRMDSGLSGGTYSGDITISSSGVANQSIALSGSVTVPSAPVANLFFSEYIEGSSNNKALEVYNASGADVNLADYKLVLYSNGAATPGNTLQMEGTLAAGAVYVVANAGSNQAILELADVTSSVTYYNGDDAVALVYVPDESIIDQIGEIGVDPGSAWPVAGVPEATVEHTLIRKPTVATGNTDWALQQGTNAEDSEWIVMPQDNIDDLGTHTYNPGAQYAEMPVFDPPAGTYFSSVSVTITSTTAGAAIRYTTDGTDPTATTGTLYSGPVSISSTTTLKAIAYAGGYEPSLVNTADYTITSSTQVADIATLRAQTTGSNVYTLTGEAILTFQQSSRNQKYIQDATGAILIDDNAGNITTTYNLYDGITGISGTLTLYSNLLQFVPVADPGEATSSNNVVEPEVRTLASLSAVDQAKLIKVMNVTITGAATFPPNAENLTATDPTASLTLRTFQGADYAGTAIPTDPVNLTCLVGQYSDTMQIGHRFLSDIEEIGGQLASPVVDLSLMDNMLYLGWNAVSGASSYRVEAADDPYAATFSVLGTTTDPGMLITPSSAKKFYRVIALP